MSGWWLSAATMRVFNRAVVAKFLRFALVGGISTGVHYIVLVMSVELFALPVLVATTAGFGAGAVVNYVLNRKFTFASRTAHESAVPKFLAIAVIGAVVNVEIVSLLLAHSSLHYIVVQLFATATVLIWTFTANSLWTFRS